MSWLLGIPVLILVSVLARRLLHLGAEKETVRSPSHVLGPQREALYSMAGEEIETHITMVAVSLNDALEEQQAGHAELALQLHTLAVGEWGRLAKVVQSLQALTVRYLVLTEYTVPLRPLTSHHFRSQIMADHVRFHSFLDQFVFRPRLRFKLHLGILRHATQILTEEFCRATPPREDFTGRGSKLDYCFHDFDLVAKESLVVFRALLACLPDSALPSLGEEVASLFGTRVPPVPLPTDGTLSS